MQRTINNIGQSKEIERAFIYVGKDNCFNIRDDAASHINAL